MLQRPGEQSSPLPIDEPTENRRQKRAKQGETASTNEMGVRALQHRVKTDLEAVMCAAAKSANLKGTFTRALKDAVQSISGASEVLAHRTRDVEMDRF